MTKLMDESDAGIRRLGAAFRPAGPEAASDDTPRGHGNRKSDDNY